MLSPSNISDDGRLAILRVDGGYIDGSGWMHYYVTDYQGNITRTVSSYGYEQQAINYYPDGEPWIEPTGENPFMFGGKERITFGGLRQYDFGARILNTTIGAWWQQDPKAEDYLDISPYSFCGGDPVNRVDWNGMEWKYTHNEGEDPKFEWVNPKDAYDSNGNLLPNHYVQAISFSAEGSKGKFNEKSSYNIGTSTATVYKADGSTENFDACTYPSNTKKYVTIPSGRYEAKVGLHKSSYTALRMSDVGSTDFEKTCIKLSFPNPYTGKYEASGINIHHAGWNNLTGFTSKGLPISMGCMTIDYNKWDDFIGIFDIPKLRNTIIGIIILRGDE